MASSAPSCGRTQLTLTSAFARSPPVPVDNASPSADVSFLPSPQAVAPLPSTVPTACASAPAPPPGKKQAKKTGRLVPKKRTKEKSVEERFKQVTPVRHVLLRPDTYVGALALVHDGRWVYDAARRRIAHRPVVFSPVLFKIFDEVLVNAADNRRRDRTMTRIDVTLDRGDPCTGRPPRLTVRNDGRGIPVQWHSDAKMYLLQLLFGVLLTGENFDDDAEEERFTGGRNGYGSKLANIFSLWFCVDNACPRTKKRYVQTFRDNMGQTDDPVITPWTGKTGYTQISFEPDVARLYGRADAPELFGSDDMWDLLARRVVDVAGTTPDVVVTLDGVPVPATDFMSYTRLFDGVAADDDPGAEVTALALAPSAPSAKAKKKRGLVTTTQKGLFYARLRNGWEVVLALGHTDKFASVSFVNSVCTERGGPHVQEVVNQVTDACLATLDKKQAQRCKPQHVKRNLCVFLNALIDKPVFHGQVKDRLGTPASAFATHAKLPPAYVKRFCQEGGLVGRVQACLQRADAREMQRHSGVKRKTLRIPKLDDANDAGGRRAEQCTLILTEGDSAKSLAVAGLSVVGRDRYGVFPLKGKLKNVRGMDPRKAAENQEVKNIVEILGLQYGRVYTDTKSLRYGHLMIMADQDHDGSHIKGLVINLIACLWPSLLRVRGFLQQFVTPIVKVWRTCRGTRERHLFYTLPDYRQWLTTHNGGAGWEARYYKGLGTSTAEDAREYFGDLPRHVRTFVLRHDGDGDGDDDKGGGGGEEELARLALAFKDNGAADRKAWLLAMDPDVSADYSGDTVSIGSFVDEELIHYSRAHNVRSLPSVVDGLKPSQRKILFGCFKRTLFTTAVKVAQLGGYVSEHAAYHHAEKSLEEAIIKMAQDYVGSNNLPLLTPEGQFGTRLKGGEDHASPRYIFTRLHRVARALFPADDDPLLTYLEDDGSRIEPQYYVPVVPFLLLNGTFGIGTGWSSKVQPYNPFEVIAAVRRRLDHLDAHEAEDDGVAGKPPRLVPWYAGFDGTVTPLFRDGAVPAGQAPTHVAIRGTLALDGDDGVPSPARGGAATQARLVITELPVGTKTEAYKNFLERLIVTRTDAAPTAYTDTVRSAFQAAWTELAAAAASCPDSNATDPASGGTRTTRTKRTCWSNATVVNRVREWFSAVRDASTERRVRFELTLTSEGARVLRLFRARAPELLLRMLHLETVVELTHMHAFTPQGKIRHYGSAEDVLDDHVPVRHALYARRKTNLLAQKRATAQRLRMRVRFVELVLNGELELRNRPRGELVKDLFQFGLWPLCEAGSDAEGPAHANKQLVDPASLSSCEDLPACAYDYLLRQELWTLTTDDVAFLRREHAAVEREVERLDAKLPTDFWREDLKVLETVVQDTFREREERNASSVATQAQPKRCARKRVKASPKDSSLKKRDVKG